MSQTSMLNSAHNVAVMRHLFEITVEEIAILVKKSVDVIGHRSSIVYKAEFLQHIDVHRLP